MPRRKPVATPEAVQAPGPATIAPENVYQLDSARAALRVPRTMLNREIKAGRLRMSNRGGRYFLLGEWMLEWLRKGELKKYSQRANQEGDRAK